MPRKPKPSPSKARPRGPVASRRAGGRVPAPSKASAILAALRRPDGASLEEMVAATGWQAHSVRGFLSGTVRKKLGLALTVEAGEGGRRYHLTAG